MTWSGGVATAVANQIAARGLSQRDVAATVGHTHTWLGKRLRRETDFSFDDVELLGKALGFDPVTLAVEARANAEKG
jgi:cyanate lyase